MDVPFNVNPAELFGAVLDGILTGTVYALMATGLSLIFGVLDIIDVAQAGYVILAAYLSFVLQGVLHIDLFLGLLITMPLCFWLASLSSWPSSALSSESAPNCPFW
jgi:branched-chain amino acid transport system permease protein